MWEKMHLGTDNNSVFIVAIGAGMTVVKDSLGGTFPSGWFRDAVV
jgi:hypothetical protein